MVLRGHSPNEGAKVCVDAWSARSSPRSTAPTSPQPFTMPAGDRGRLHQHQRVLPPRPPPSQAHPEQSVRWAKAPIRTTKDRQLMAQCQTLNEEVSTDG
jgi:hypothetical protein